jgi:DNA-binding CsgD family transcriptional regulator
VANDQAKRRDDSGDVNETEAADRALMEHFFRARRRAKWPLVLVSQRIMQTNTAAATLVQSADHTLLWQWGSDVAATRDSTESALQLTSGLPVAVRAWPVEVSGLLAGVLVRLEPMKPDSAAGPRSGEGGKRRTAYGWPSLTSTECSVAAIIAEGATNREAAARLLLSRHTIDFHLRQIFRKLEIRSRVELTRLVIQHSSTGHSAPNR